MGTNIVESFMIIREKQFERTMRIELARWKPGFPEARSFLALLTSPSFLILIPYQRFHCFPSSSSSNNVSQERERKTESSLEKIMKIGCS